MEFQEFASRAKSGEIWIGIDSIDARRFYCDGDPAEVHESTGYDSRVDSLLVRGVWLMQFISLLMGVILSIVALRWYSVIAVPMMVLAFILLCGSACKAPVRLHGAIALQVVFVVLASALREYGLFKMFFCLVLPTPFVFAKSTYWLATRLLRRASIGNERLYELLRGTTLIIRADPQA